MAEVFPVNWCAISFVNAPYTVFPTGQAVGRPAYRP